MKSGYDVIGDIHGQAAKLEELLGILGYQEVDGVYQHPQRRAVFVGDFIDRGPNHRRVISIVRPMVEQGHALAVLGNHEYNAIGYHTRHPITGEPLRPHSEQNERQQRAFLAEYPLDHPDTADLIAWFKTLPLFLELDGFRVIHACWSQLAIDRLRPRLGPGNRLTEELLLEGTSKGSQTYRDLEVLLKGPEHPLPEGSAFRDKDNHERHEIRVAWWGGAPRNWGEMALSPEHVPVGLRATPVPESAKLDFYPEDAPPVFVGHYWLHGSPGSFCRNVTCVDYSAGVNGPLMAYRWAGPDMYGENFVSAEHGPFPLEHLRAAHKRLSDIDALLASERVGCFHCLSVMPVRELTNPNGPDWCPRCYMDALIGDRMGYPLTRAFLASMRRRFFDLDVG